MISQYHGFLNLIFGRFLLIGQTVRQCLVALEVCSCVQFSLFGQRRPRRELSSSRYYTAALLPRSLPLTKLLGSF